MLVREKVDERQFEWYRDNNEFYYRLKHLAWGGFLLQKNSQRSGRKVDAHKERQESLIGSFAFGKFEKEKRRQ